MVNLVKQFFAVVTSGPLKGRKFIVEADSKILIGRGKESDIRIDSDDFCSRKHALLYWFENKCFLEDLKSTNGTFLNRKKLIGKKEVKNHDIIGLGHTEIIIGIKNVSKSENN